MTIQWFPGHIAKAKRLLKDQLKLVDLILEIADARIPESSRLSDPSIVGEKPIILVFTKGDLADPQLTRLWLESLRSEGREVIDVVPAQKKGLKELNQRIGEHARRLTERMKGRGRLPRPIRVMVVGLPNVGKSTLINLLIGKHAAKTADRAGVTRAPQWLRIGHNLELLDTPGIIPPRLDNQKAAIKLVLTGGIGSEAYDPEEVASQGLEILAEYAPEVLQRYGNPKDLDDIARNRNFLLPGGKPNRDRAAKTLLAELRQGTGGPMTLDPPPGAVQKADGNAIIGSSV